jgi:hypothetical protein
VAYEALRKPHPSIFEHRNIANRHIFSRVSESLLSS